MIEETKDLKANQSIPHGNNVMVELRSSNIVDDIQGIVQRLTRDVPEFVYDQEYGWVEVPDPPYAELQENERAYVIRGKLKTQSWAKIKGDNAVIKVYRDTPIQAISTCNCSCSASWTPRLRDVRRFLGVDQIWKKGIRGQGITVGIVDSGISASGRAIDGKIPRVTDGFPNDWGQRSDWNQHGNMVSIDLLGIAPKVNIYDIRISELYGTGRISNVLKAYEWIEKRFQVDGTPQILSNSWALFREHHDLSYARSRTHVFTRKVEQIIDLGVKVLFAAGNCGCDCMTPRCGMSIGPHKSIWGANGHPDVITIGAVKMHNRLVESINYSSPGPAALHHNKPDFSVFSHFKGYRKCDDGTSAACPVAAGIVALLLGTNKGLSQTLLKNYLASTSRTLNGSWNHRTGYGLIDALEAFRMVN